MTDSDNDSLPTIEDAMNWLFSLTASRADTAEALVEQIHSLANQTRRCKPRLYEFSVPKFVCVRLNEVEIAQFRGQCSPWEPGNVPHDVLHCIAEYENVGRIARRFLVRYRGRHLGLNVRHADGPFGSPSGSVYVTDFGDDKAAACKWAEAEMLADVTNLRFNIPRFDRPTASI